MTNDNLDQPSQHNRPIAKSSNGSPSLSPEKDPRNRDSPLAAAEKETRRLARSHYENFLVASLLLPRRLHQPFYNVYAFCRTADDVADESASPQLALQGLERLQQALDAVFEGRPSEGMFLALAKTVEQFGLSKQPFDDLLDAFRQDQRKTRYQTFDEVLDYCRRSANPVGRIVLSLAGCDGEANSQLADAICTGLQLANFLQDVSRDYQRGRIYLAADQMERFGVDETMFRPAQTAMSPSPANEHQASPTPAISTSGFRTPGFPTPGFRTPAPLRELLSDECARAEDWLRRGLPLADRVPRWFAADVRLFAHGGLVTLDAIRGIDCDVLRIRPTVSKWKQLSLLLRAGLRLL